MLTAPQSQPLLRLPIPSSSPRSPSPSPLFVTPMLLQLSHDVVAPLCLPVLFPICNALEMRLSVYTTRAFPRRQGQGMENLPDFFGLRWSILNSIAPLNHVSR
ncbi:hypothetical protein NL676_030964 [Syzygium grande]|nr:hypothetical protein NL676_030964 [Syzygium grande]